MKNTNTSKNSRQITLPELEHYISVTRFNGAPYPAMEYIENNIHRSQEPFRGRMIELERKAHLKSLPVRRLILHWIYQGLDVSGINSTNPEDGYKKGIVDEHQLTKFLSEQRYAIPDFLNNGEPARDSTDNLDPRKETTHLQLIRALLAETDIDMNKPYKAAEVIRKIKVDGKSNTQLPGDETIANVLKAVKSQLG